MRHMGERMNEPWPKPRPVDPDQVRMPPGRVWPWLVVAAVGCVALALVAFFVVASRPWFT